MKYVSRVRQFEVPLTLPDGSHIELVDDEDRFHLTGQTVLEDDPEWTGLLDADGNGLYRVKDKIGF